MATNQHQCQPQPTDETHTVGARRVLVHICPECAEKYLLMGWKSGQPIYIALKHHLKLRKELTDDD